ncbi:cytochrome C assembly family protein [Haloferula chungangensis]|uniref:cytochrome C assembly family protein n=1 Tax=Haloferula chungangensis TaxID=1048331 RepID=UPI0036D2FE27
MDRWFLIAATLLAAIGGVTGMVSLRHDHRSRWTFPWMAAAFVAQLGFLWLRGEARGACPLIGTGEILVFLAWSLTLFYLAVGPTYRISLLGVFSAPVVVVFQAVALLPGMLSSNPERVPSTDAWRETHAAMSVLGYGALALSAVAGVMFLVLDRQLKDHHLNSGLFRNLPPVRELLTSMQRLLWLGMLMLTVGVVAGFMMGRTGDASHLIAAVVVWLAYLALIVLKQTRGMTGRRFSMAVVLLFVVSLSVFGFI